MKRNWQRFAPLGAYLALIAAIVALALYIIQREWNLNIQISLGVVVLGLAIYALLDPQRARSLLTGRQARYGSNAMVIVLAFLGILVVLNYFVFKNSQRWDLTEGKQNTLAPETVDTLASLPEQVEAQAFFSPRVPPDRARTLLEQFKFASRGNFDFQFIDPEANPVAARDAQITRDGSIVLHMGDRKEPVSFVSEREITAAMVRLMSHEENVVYFLTGHGEFNPEDTGDESYSQAKQTLETKNYSVKVLNLLAEKVIPEDATVIVIAGPTKPLTGDEMSALRSYEEQGGSLVVMEEPVEFTSMGGETDPLADYLNEAWGIGMDDTTVVDWTSVQPLQVFAASYGAHAITSKLQNLGTAFPTARRVSVEGQREGMTRTELIRTASQSWAETDLQDLEQAIQSGTQLSPGEDDIPGPLSIAVSAERSDTSARIVVFGDAHFAINANFTYLGNGDLFINAIDWAAQQENLINLTPKESITRTLVPPQRYTLGLILFGSVFLLPGLVLGSGIVVWLQRRKRG